MEPSHAFAEAIKIAPRLSSQTIIVVNSCGDSLKDKFIIKKKLRKKIVLFPLRALWNMGLKHPMDERVQAVIIILLDREGPLDNCQFHKNPY